MNKNVEYFNNGQTTVAILTMPSGFQVVGKHQQIGKFIAEVGRQKAYDDAVGEANKLHFYEMSKENSRDMKLKAEEEEIRQLMKEMHQKEQQNEKMREPKQTEGKYSSIGEHGFYHKGGQVQIMSITDLAEEAVKVLKLRGSLDSLNRTVFNEPEPTEREKGKYTHIFE